MSCYSLQVIWHLQIEGKRTTSDTLHGQHSKFLNNTRYGLSFEVNGSKKLLSYVIRLSKCLSAQNVNVYSLGIPVSLADCIITPLVMGHILLQSHLLWGEFNTLSNLRLETVAIQHFSFHEVPIAAEWMRFCLTLLTSNGNLNPWPVKSNALSSCFPYQASPTSHSTYDNDPKHYAKKATIHQLTYRCLWPGNTSRNF